MQPAVTGGWLRPLGARVLVRPDAEQDRTDFGLLLPSTARDQLRAQTGTVEAAGPDVLDLAAGDRVLYRQWGGVEVTVGGQLLLLLRTRQPPGEPPDLYATI